MSDMWINHLNGLADLEDNVGKKVAFLTSAEKIESLEKRVKELDDRLLDKQNANKALFSIYDESEVENNLLKDKVKELEADNKRKAKVLVDVRNLIERHDIDVFGSNTDGKLEWPLSAEVIDDITKAL
jgi:chromosome segregation ATPase